MKVMLKNPVTEIVAAEPAKAAAHYNSRLAYETDCWDVHATQELDERGFVLVDVRSRELFLAGHLPGAVHIPHQTISESHLAEYPHDTLFVTYCSGPHCNGSTRGAARIAALGRPVKEMLGGVTGWLSEGYELDRS